MDKFVVSIIQIIVSIMLVSLILLQSKGTGFGKSSFALSNSFTKRGVEKLVFRLTFFLTAVFLCLSILQLFI